MNQSTKRVQHESKLQILIQKINKYAYLETLTIVAMYLLVGYLINEKDICILHHDISYILILLSIITLFHGFENGLLALGVLALAMWFFYPIFEYIEFLVALMMTMIFSEFHYYWTKRIKEAEISANYRGTKLDELTKSFYTLKISHDQLEKNYVVKPMSIRNSVEQIINQNKIITKDKSIDDKNEQYYRNFLLLLEKSFSVTSGLILYKNDSTDDLLFSEETSSISYNSNSKHYALDEVFKDYLVDKALNNKQTIYVSDESGDPGLNSGGNSQYIAVIPSIQDGQVISMLVIETMPFMSFNRENLTSIAILLEYFSLEILASNKLATIDKLSIVENKEFRYEFSRLEHIYKKFNVNSIVLVLRLKSELQITRIYDIIVKMLRSLDMVARVDAQGIYYIVFLFPLHDKSAALGYLARLVSFIEEEQDKKFNHMTFSMSEIELLNKYLREDYDQ